MAGGVANGQVQAWRVCQVPSATPLTKEITPSLDRHQRGVVDLGFQTCPGLTAVTLTPWQPYFH